MLKNSQLLKLTAFTFVTNFFLAIPSVIATPYFQKGQDPIPSKKTWHKVDNMSDEFEGTSLNLSKWQQEPVGNGWSWIGREPGLFDKKSVSVAEGKMRVTVSKLDAPTTIRNREYLYQGAIVRSIHPGQHGWYYEAKMKANATEMSSTFWLMSKNSNCKTKHELDIQENVGVVSPNAETWAADWDRIFHSNAFHRKTRCNNRTQLEGSVLLKDGEKNSDRFFVYGAWWKSPNEVRFYLDGEYQYTINPSTPFNQSMWLQMAIETYDWNPVPADGGKIASGTWAERTTQYEWVRTWQVIDR